MALTAKDIIGLKSPPYTVPVEKGQLKFFAKATGIADPIYTDEAAAKQAGYASLPVPPTFLFSLCMLRPDSPTDLDKLGFDLTGVLHGEQKFDYYRPVCAGDEITLQGEIIDYYEKKGGALKFLKEMTTATNQHGIRVADLTNIAVIREMPGATR